MSDHLAEQYERFRRGHACTYLDRGPVRWEYIVSGQGEQTLLILPGALGTAETSFEYILAFEPAYRVVSVSYPSAITSVAPLVRGLLDILDAESVARAHVIGGSYSGFIAQSLVRQHPGRVRSLILSDAGIPQPERIAKTKALLLAASVRPWSAMRAMLRLANRLALRDGTPQHRFWRSYFDAVLDSISPEEVIARLTVTIDFDRGQAFSPSDLDGWDGAVMIVDADGDRLFNAAERAAVRDLYPAARHHTFRDGGHSGTLDNAQEYIALYRDFLERLPA
jgi:pimeloyl-ACP methyl ester carboxylesterase